jgi:hypothetical protein
MLIRSTQITSAAMLGLGLLAAGCSTSRSVPDKEAMLTSAGFEQRPAATPKQQARMEQLPPNKLVQRQWKGKPVYVYADPAGCRCIYLGNQAAYARYRQNARDEREAVAANENASFDGEAWGMTGWRD